MTIDTLRERWSGLGARERRFVVAGALVVGAAIANVLLWRPIEGDLARAGRDAARAETRLERARAAALDGSTRGETPARAPLDVAIRTALARAGITAADATLEMSAGRATLLLASVRFDTLIALLDALAREGAVHVVDATISARVEADRVRAELTRSR